MRTRWVATKVMLRLWWVTILASEYGRRKVLEHFAEMCDRIVKDDSLPGLNSPEVPRAL